MSRNTAIIRATTILAILVLLLAALPVSPAWGDSAGPNNPGTAVNDTSIGTVPWTAPGNITTPGEPYASVSFDHFQNQVSNYLVATNYGFNIPDNATILGITVEINKEVNTLPSLISDNVVSLVQASALVGQNKANVGVGWTDVLTVTTYGSAADLWGTTWTPAQINNPGFGVALSVTKPSNGNRSATVDFVQVTVTYTYLTETTVDCGAGVPLTTYGSSITCVATVTRLTGVGTPGGTVSWSSDGTGSFVGSPCTLTGSGGIATCSASYTPGVVGSGAHLVTASYDGDVNFSRSSASQSVIVDPRPLTVSADAQGKAYGDPDPALTYTVTSGSLVAGDAFSGDLARDPGEDLGTYAIRQGSLALSSNYDLTYVGADLAITPRPVTVTADAQTKVYGESDPALTYAVTSGSLLAGDSFTGALSRDPGEDVGAYTILQGSLALSSNYDLTYVGADLAITQRPLAVTADAQTKVYGEPDPALTYTVTTGSLVAGDAFTGALARDPGEDVGTYAILQGSLALSSNYDLSYTGANLAITPRPLTVTADAQTKVYGDPDPALTFAVTSGSLVAGDAFSGALTRDPGEDVGAYAILQGSLALSSNYDLSYTGADLAITPRPLTVTADAQTKVYGDPDPALTFAVTSGSLVAGDAFSGALTRDPGEDVGAYAILQGSLALSSNYDLSYVGADLTISKATPTLSVTNSPVVYDGLPHAADVVGSVPGTVSQVTYDGSYTLPMAVGSYAVTADFTPLDTTNYNSLSGASAGDFVISPAITGLTLAITPTPAIFDNVGDAIAYSYLLTNSGEVPLAGPFTVSDDLVTVTCPDVATLAPGDTLTCTASHTITASDVAAVSVTNTATAAGYYAGEPVVSASAQATVTISVIQHLLYMPMIVR